MGRAPCCSKVGLHKGAWSSQEDALLTTYIQANGEGKWRSLPLKAGLLRCGKSCRLRWMNYLRPGVKRGNITAEEEELIIRLRSVVGNRWSLIAGKLPGRTDNEIKNHWNTHLLKRLKKEAGLITEPPPTKSRKKYHPKRSKKHPRNVVLNPSTSTDDNNNKQEEAINIVVADDNNKREVSEVSWSSLDQLDEQSLNEGSVNDPLIVIDDEVSWSSLDQLDEQSLNEGSVNDPLIVIDDEYFWDLSSQGGGEELVLNDNLLVDQFYHEYLQLL